MVQAIRLPSDREDAHEPRGVKALDRALALLNAFSVEQPEWSVGEIARSFGMSKATASRTLAVMERAGYLRRDRRHQRFRLGPRLLERDAGALESNGLAVVAPPHLQRLRDGTGDTACVYEAMELVRVLIQRISGKGVYHWTADIGSVIPLHRGAGGKAIMAFWTEARQDATVRSLAVRFPEIGIPHLLVELREIRAQGFAVTYAETSSGSIGVAAPVFDFMGESIGSVTLVRTAVAFDGEAERRSRAVPLVIACADAISVELGYRRR